MAATDLSVVKSYDIRGVYPGQIDERFAYLLGRALPQVLPARYAAVGHDCRLSSPGLYAALSSGLRDGGVRVRGLGLCPTELAYFVVGGRFGLDLGVVVTASHNPPEYNGFKVVKAGGEPVTGDTGLMAACELMGGLGQAPGEFAPPLETIESLGDYVEFALALVGMPDARGLEVVVDAGSGVGGLLWDGMADRLGVRLTRINCEADGRFPAHHPDPSKAENLRQLIEATKSAGADLGLAYDGDADRVVAVLDDGHVVNGSEMVACLAQRLAGEDPQVLFGVGQTLSRRALDHFRARGLGFVLVPVGHSKIKRLMRADGRMLFAGEDAGHYYFRDFHCCDSSLITTLHLLHLAAQGRIGDLVRTLPGPWLRPTTEPAFRFDDRERAFRVCREAAVQTLAQHPDPIEITCERGGRIQRRCTPQDISTADSVRADYADWWFCVRPSGTEPIVRLSVEARNEALLKERTGRLCGEFEGRR
jgi:phosphomannomutase